MDDGGLHKIEDLKKRLYSRSVPPASLHQHALSSEPSPPTPSWPAPESPSRLSFPLVKIFFLVSLVFFMGALLYASSLFLRGSNLLSSDNIDIEVRGPVSVGAGDPLSFDLSIRNNNTTPLELVDLLLEYPLGTRSATDLAQDLPRQRESLGTIAPGEQVNRRFAAAIFGEEKSAQEIKIILEYRVPGSNAIFHKNSAYTLALSSSPLSFTLDAPRESASGQSVEFTLAVRSNSPEVMKAVAVRAEYPPGFKVVAVEPAETEASFWLLGDLPPKGKREIKIQGVVSGESEDDRVFRFEAGLSGKGDNPVISTPFVSLLHQISISRPFIGLSISVQGKSEQEIPIESGRPVRVGLTYTNNLSIPIENAVITLALSGEALDRSTVSPEQGFYQSQNDTVVWDRSTKAELARVAPGEKGLLNLTLSARGLSDPGVTSLRNPKIVLSGSARGDRDESGEQEAVRGSVSRTLKVVSVPEIKGEVLYAGSPFRNKGPLPPRVGQETTYTVVWSLTNAFNQVAQSNLRAQLPSYINFVSGGVPSTEKLSFDESSRVVSWNVGNLKAGVGFGSVRREVSFQVALTPSLSQVFSAPDILGESLFEGVDTFTGVRIKISHKALTTKTLDGKTGEDIVLK